MKYKITVNHDECIGCGACESACDNFKVTDGKSNPVKSEVAELGCNEKARDGCPVQAITIEEIK